MFDNQQQKCFFKSFPLACFPRKGLSKNFGDEAHLETFLKDSIEDVIKISQMMSYTELRLRTTRKGW